MGLADRMESFFLAETTKYLYLLFDPENFIHNRGNIAEVIDTPHGKCTIDAGGYIFNTEAHPIDPAALACCSAFTENEVQNQLASQMVDILNPGKIRKFKGDLVPERLEMLEKKREQQIQEKKERQRIMREKLEAMKQQAQHAAEEQKRIDEEKRKKMAQIKVENSSNTVTDIVDIGIGNQSGGEVKENSDSKPKFSGKNEANVEIKDTGKQTQAMITKVSRGEVLEGRSVDQGAIVQPADMKNIFEKKGNLLVKAINNLVEHFLPTESAGFDLQAFASKLKTENLWPIEKSWTTDHEAMSCPAVKFTDRFLIHGEFFEERTTLGG